MAENYRVAFGRYLKTLRERRGMSLEDVCSLSGTFAEKLNKGYISRCENGLQKLAFSKVIPLSRIYEVPADALVERMEMDMELDRAGGPETEGKSFAELADLGREAIVKGYLWNAYGYVRDALTLAPVSPLRPNYADLEEQIAGAHMNCATVARALGRIRYALHEYLYLQALDHFSPKHRSLVLERIGACYRLLEQFSLAKEYVDAAIKAAEANEDQQYLGYLYETRGLIELTQQHPESAVDYFKRAFELFRQGHRDTECVRVLNNLAQGYFDLQRYGAARRAATAADRQARELLLLRPQALSRILLGEIDEVEEKPLAATRRWKEAVEISKELNDKELRFKAEFVLFRQALHDGNRPIARAIERRLRRLSPWIPEETYELATFKSLVSENETLFNKTVSK
jgi:tetratricopeptide (TPR) repeat protein